MNKVLIVDDDPIFRDAVRVMLQDYEVAEAAEGSAALRVFRRMPDAIVLCDIFMSGIEGLETIRELRRANPHAKIIAMTADNSLGGIDVLVHAAEDGADLTLRKPFDEAQLLETIAKIG